MRGFNDARVSQHLALPFLHEISCGLGSVGINYYNSADNGEQLG
jgi:hypothetical protein